MNEPATGPEPLDWLTAAVRGFHPVRWLLCLAGVVLTLLSAAVAQALLDGNSPDWLAWWESPAERARSFGDAVAQRSFAALVFRIGLMLAATTAMWCLVGGWIARHELLARLRGEPYEAPRRLEPTPTRLVVGQAKNLVLGCTMSLILIAIALLPVTVAGLVNRAGGPGAIAVALLLPIVLIGDLVVLLLVIGFLAWPLMAVTIAAENSDVFDALSRAYNYAFVRPIRFTLLMLIAVAISSTPVVLVLYPFADAIAGLQAPVAPFIIWIAAALSASIFWSLVTLVYLNLRAAVDGTEPRSIALDGDEKPETPSATNPATKKDKTTAPPKPTNPFGFLGLLLVMIATWYLTTWLFRQVGGEQTEWLNWGYAEGFVPKAEGMYAIASFIAVLWGVMWVSAPILVQCRRWLRGDDSKPKSEPEA